MTQYKTERQWWDILSRNDAEGALVKERLDRNRIAIRAHLEKFDGLKSHMRDVAYAYAEDVPTEIEFYRSVQEIDPDALQLLAKHGIEYTPFLWNEPPAIEPELGSCYVNSYYNLRAYNKVWREKKMPGRLVYVEGIGIASRMVQHAWNSLSVDCDTAIDSTWYAMTGWYSYIGIPFTERQYLRARKLAYGKEPRCRLLHRDVFPKIRTYVQDLLDARATKKR